MLKKIFTITDRWNLERCYPIMKELRPHLSIEIFFSIYEAIYLILDVITSRTLLFSPNKCILSTINNFIKLKTFLYFHLLERISQCSGYAIIKLLFSRSFTSDNVYPVKIETKEFNTINSELCCL